MFNVRRKEKKLTICLLLRSKATVNLCVKEGDICVNFAAVSEAAKVLLTALGSGYSGEGHTQGQCTQFLGYL